LYGAPITDSGKEKISEDIYRNHTVHVTYLYDGCHVLKAIFEPKLNITITTDNFILDVTTCSGLI